MTNDAREARYPEVLALAEGVTPDTDPWHDQAARRVIALAEQAALVARVAELEAERDKWLHISEDTARAFNLVEARAEAAEQRERTLRERVEGLFAGGPDTPCRTTWRFDFAAHCEGYDGREECVEVPLADLRAALSSAASGASRARTPAQPEAGSDAPEATPVNAADGGYVIRKDNLDDLRAEVSRLAARCLELRAVEVRLAALGEAVIDLCWKATPMGQTEEGDVHAYILPKGTVHRLIGAAQCAGIAASFRAAPAPTTEGGEP